MPRRKLKSDANSLNAAKMIDAAFEKKVKITIGTQSGRVSTFAAIVLLLTQKALTDRRALRVLSRYRAYAAKRGGNRMNFIFAGARDDQE